MTRSCWLLILVVGFGVSLLELVASTASGSDTIDPNNDGSQYAWAENIGWFNAEPLGDGGPGMRVLATRVDGWLWMENAGWVSLSCHNTHSCSTVDYEVTLDGNGALAGYGWSENLGWISFSCANTESCATVDYRVTIDPVTGEFSGFAWAENFGWISFSCENTGSCASVDYRVVTELPFPGAFVKVAPLDSATGQPVDLTLSWGSSINATSYEYCIDTIDNDACDASWVSVGLVTSVQVTGLSEWTTYFWQVRAVNAYGSVEANSGVWWLFVTTPYLLSDGFESGDTSAWSATVP